MPGSWGTAASRRWPPRPGCPRAASTRRPKLLRTLEDGSCLARLGTLTVRIIEADLTVHLADGNRITGRYRLATTLLDPATDPAERLVRLYAERWEIESAYFALRATLMNGRVLRSRDRFGIEQELWATLTAYQTLRMAMTDAAAQHSGTDPGRASFTHALTTARAQVTLAAGTIPDPTGRPGAITEAVLDNLLPARRPRVSARKVKSPVSRCHSWHGQARPTTATAVEHVEITLCDRTGAAPHAPAAVADQTVTLPSHDDESVRTTPAQAVGDPPAGRLQLTLAVMNSDPDKPWQARDVARVLGITNLNSFRVQMSQWSQRGLIKKTSKATYSTRSPVNP